MARRATEEVLVHDAEADPHLEVLCGELEGVVRLSRDRPMRLPHEARLEIEHFRVELFAIHQLVVAARFRISHSKARSRPGES